MQKSLELCTDRTTCGAGYALLAYHTASRSGMWTKGVDVGRGRRSGSSGPSSSRRPRAPARAQALAARAFLRPASGAEAAREASAIADRAGRRRAAVVRVGGAGGGRVRAAASSTRRQRSRDSGSTLLPEISDPDHILGVYEAAIPALAGVGELDEAAQRRARAPGAVSHADAAPPDPRRRADAGDPGARRRLEGDPQLERPRSRKRSPPTWPHRAAATHGICSSARRRTSRPATTTKRRRLERAADACGMEDSGSGLAGARLRLAHAARRSRRRRAAADRLGRGSASSSALPRSPRDWTASQRFAIGIASRRRRRRFCATARTPSRSRSGRSRSCATTRRSSSRRLRGSQCCASTGTPPRPWLSHGRRDAFEVA